MISNSTNRTARRQVLKAAGVSSAVALAGCLAGSGDDSEDGATISGPVKIGAMGPADQPFGSSILNAAQLAADEINADGGIAGNDVEIIQKDTKDDPNTAQNVYQELTTGEDVDFTVGIFGSEQLLSIMPNMAEQETIHLTAGAATPDASRQVSENYERFKYWFRAGPTNSFFLADSLITFANDRFDQMGWDRIGLLVEDFKWTKPVRQQLDERKDEFNAEVAVEKVVPEGTEDFSPVYDEMESANVDGCYTVLAHIGSTSLVQWAKQQRPFGYGGIHVPAQLPSYYKATKGAARFAFTQTTATPNAAVTEKTKPFAKAYSEEFGKFPVYNGYSAYDAVYLLRKAAEEAGTTNSDDVIPVLENVNQGGVEMVGSAGIPEFYGKDHRFTHDLKYNDANSGVYFQWRDGSDTGSQKVIWPDDLATAEYQSPPWV